MKFRRLFQFTARSTDDIRRELDEEFAFHIEMRAGALRKEGMSNDDAHAQALREFGQRSDLLSLSSGRVVERRRSFRRLVSELKQDTTYGVRLLTRSPGFSLACVLTLAVGIGSTTAVFSVVNAAFLAPPPIAAAGEVVRVQLGESRMSSPVFEELRARNTVFATMAASANARLALGEPGSTTPVMAERVSTTYFSMLGVAAAIGRTFDAADTRDDLVVLGEHAWRVHFNGDTSVIGLRVTLDRRVYEVIGVMPRGFRGLAAPGWVRDCWIPLPRATAPASATRFEVAGRLQPGVDPATAAAALRAIAQQLRIDRPELPESITAVQLIPVSGINAFRGVGALVPVFMFVALLALVAGFVLMIGCANIAGLLLGRAVARRHELAVRAALGAARGRLIRQLLTESVLLAALGGTAGVLLASWLTRLIPVVVSELNFPLDLEVAIDWRVLAFTSAVSLVTAILFGLAPARHAVRVELGAALRDGASTARRQRLRQALVVGQVAACATLLIWGLLFARSLGHVTAMQPGFDANGVLLADVIVDAAPEASAGAFEARMVELQDRARALPFVESAGAAWAVPLALTARESFSVFLEGESSDSRGRVVNANRLTPGWFATLRIPLLAGRDFTWNDRSGAPEVAIVNRTLADRFWNGRAIGRRLRFTGSRDIAHDVEIVGIVADSKYWTIGETIEPVVYLAARQGTMSDGLTLHVRTSNLADTSRRLAKEFERVALDGHIELRPMSDAVAVAMMPARVGAVVTSAFAGVAVLLATVGIYALISFSVAQRTREIGVRKALGASPMGIVRLVTGQSLLLVVVGLVVGILAGVAGGHGLASLTVGVSPGDPLTIAIAIVLVVSAALLASSIPAIRAARADPLRALRQE